MVFQFMFFDALSPLYLKGFRAFYVFCPIFTDFRGVLQKLNSGSTLPKDKAASRRQYEEYGKAKPTRYFGKGSRYGSMLPKDKAASHRQTMQYDKAKPTQQRRSLAKGTLYQRRLETLINRASQSTCPPALYL